MLSCFPEGRRDGTTTAFAAAHADRALRLAVQIRDLTLSVRVHQRYRVIDQVRRGYRLSEAAERVGCHFTVAYDWVHRSNASGFRTFEQAPNARGRPPILRAEQLRELVDVVLSSPSERGLPFSVWPVPKLAEYCRRRKLLPAVTDEWVEARHLRVLKAGFYAALPYLVYAVSDPVGGWIADLLVRRDWDETRRRKGIVTVAFVMGMVLSNVTLVTQTSTAVLLISGVLLVGLVAGNLLVILQRCAQPDEIGAWTGVESFARNLGGASPLVTDFLISSMGSFLPGFVLGPSVLVTGLLAYWFIVGKLPPAQTASACAGGRGLHDHLRRKGSHGS